MNEWLTPEDIAMSTSIPLEEVVAAMKLGVLRAARLGRQERRSTRPWVSDWLRGRSDGYSWVAPLAPQPVDVAGADKAPCSSSIGHVYFVAAYQRQFVKIGWTQSMKSRLAAPQTAHPTQLELLAFKRGAVSLERWWHQQWRHQRLHGEWFTLSSELLASINRLASRGVS